MRDRDDSADQPAREPTLASLQAWFYRVVTAPEGVATALATASVLDGELLGDARLSAVARLEIYADMYFVRLNEVLASDFPRLAAHIGQARFDALVAAYLAASPPTERSVREVGRGLPAFIAAHGVSGAEPWLADLARLERARLEVFDARDDTLLALAALREIAAERVATLELRLVQALATLLLDLGALYAWASSASPGGEQRATVIVWRGCDPMVVHQRPLDDDERALWPELASGITFGALCERLAAGRSDDEAVALAARLVTRWLDQGLLAAPPTEAVA